MFVTGLRDVNRASKILRGFTFPQHESWIPERQVKEAPAGGSCTYNKRSGDKTALPGQPAVRISPSSLSLLGRGS